MADLLLTSYLGIERSVITPKRRNMKALKRFTDLETPASKWWGTRDGVVGVAREILEQLGNDANRMVIGTDFSGRKFALRNGDQVKGDHLLQAVAWMEKPDIATQDAVRALGNRSGILRVLKRDYLGLAVPSDEWKNSMEGIVRVAREILDEHLDGDADNLGLRRTRFFCKTFSLKGGERVSGVQALSALAKLMHPDLSVDDAVAKAGGYSNLARLLKAEMGILVFDDEWRKSRAGVVAVAREVFDWVATNRRYQAANGPSWAISSRLPTVSMFAAGR